MKKLMVAAMVAVCAIAVNAASTTWGYAGAIQDVEGNDFTDGTAFLFLTTGADKAPAWNSKTGSWDMNGATLVALTLGEQTYTGRNFDPDMFAWGDFDTTAPANLPSSDLIIDNGEQYYSIIITSEKTTDFASFKGDDKYAAVVSGQAAQESNFDESGNVFYYENMINFDDVTSASWTQLKTDAVPEPTSGLLLLLGVAGLALRRRRA